MLKIFLTILFTVNLLYADVSQDREISAFNDHKEWFETFLKNTDQKKVQKETTLSILQENFPYIWERISNPDYPFATLFIGAGNGEIEIFLLKEFETVRGSSDNFITYCEDPSQEMKNRFLTRAQELIKSKIVEYNLLPFQASSYSPPQADFALASHSWYFIDEWKNMEKEFNTLVKFASTLSKRSGVGLITLQSKHGARYRLNSNYATMKGLKKEVVAEELMVELEKLDIPYNLQLIESHLNVESCFENDIFKPNEEGKQILSFLLLTSWDDLSPELQDQISKIFLVQAEESGKQELILRDYHILISGNQKFHYVP